MAALVSFDDAKRHLRITDSAHDADVQVKLEEATDIIVNFLKERADPNWTETTVPLRIQSAIKMILTHLYRHRGDDMAPVDEDLWAAVTRLLGRDRDPALA